MKTGRPSNPQTLEQKKRYTIIETGWVIAEIKQNKQTNKTNKQTKMTKVRIEDFGGNNFSPFKSERALSSMIIFYFYL